MMDENINTGPIVDTSTPTHGTGTVSSILSAKDKTQSAAGTQARNLAETASAMETLDQNITKLLDNLKNASADITKSPEFKEFTKVMKTFKESFADTTKILEKGSTDITTLAKSVEKSNNAYDEMNMLYALFNGLLDENGKIINKLTADKKKELELNKADFRYRKQLRSRQRDEIINDAKEGNKSIGDAISKMSKDIGDRLTNIKTLFSLDAIESKLGSARTSSAEIQLQMMNSMNLNRSEFNSFKKQLYSQIDTSIYSAQDIRQAISSLSDLGINTTTEAIDKMNTIVRGQQLLGLSADQQAKLQMLGNKTGRDSLTFTTNRLAKWMSMSTNIGQKQLSELVDLNTNFLSQFSDIGINSEEFESMTGAASAALTALTGDTQWASKYQDILTNLATSPTSAATGLGLSVGQFKDMLSGGTDLATMIQSGRGQYGSLYNQFMKNYDHVNANLPHYTTEAGIDANTASFIQRMAQYDLRNGRGSFAEYLKSFEADGTDNKYLKDVEKNTSDATDGITKLANEFTNWVSENTDWVTMSKITTFLDKIVTLLGVVASAVAIDSFSDIASMFKGKGAVAKGSTLKAAGTGLKTLGSGALSAVTAGKYGTALTKATAKTATKAIGKVSAPLTLLEMGIDGVVGYNTTSKEMYGENATTGQKWLSAASTAVSSSTVHRNKNGEVSVGKNTLMGAGSGALKGAAIGAFFGPVGAGIGAIAGGLIGGLGGYWKGKKAKEQEDREKAALKAAEETAQNTSNTSKLLQGVQLSQAHRAVTSVRSYTGGSNLPSMPGHVETRNAYDEFLLRNSLIGIGDLSKFTGKSGQYAGPWRVSSPYGMRKDPGTGKEKMHKGIDLTAGGTHQIYATHAGTVKHVNHGAKSGYGPYGVYVTTPDGKTQFQYGHMKAMFVKDGQYVEAGTHLGTMGNMGYSFGQHLHYQVNRNGAHTNPVPYINETLWTGKASSSSTSLSGISLSDTDNSSVLNTVFKARVNEFSPSDVYGTGDGVGLITSGLAEIKKTLIELSERQTRDEQIMSMLQGSKKHDPRIV